MSDYVLFQMTEQVRKDLIDRHLFYVDQARKRFLSHFDDIEAEANGIPDKWLEQHEHLFDPERHDPSDFYEAAIHARYNFYELICDMRERTQLSVIAGMFHEWDKQLRDWLSNEILHCHHGPAVRDEDWSFTFKAVWSAKFKQVVDLLECLGWQIERREYFQKLNACQLIVNVYKHGNGESLKILKKDYPEYYRNPFQHSRSRVWRITVPNYKDLRINDAQFRAFSNAIVSFWMDTPGNIYKSQVESVPDWLGKAILKDDNRSVYSKKVIALP
ncbi:hypothetical protein Rvan_2742 [Rhodomicrobium vannielii ATCC 17100]|uniref:Uncharacterized protein n=1 Tax=Rhodomicrobium vannielii (strain ATCC 17100 / DSM 162 / LMG 4299 / NCIMB 10020 / ATH 3.1.1) TaxID=648757 RepID=E3I827_RHOVT|nr:hypothetical protein [Rhodomicrobium vannielii]ADP71953.1 hypothetical protein Rvan_2742 [Rhodomicrobium vannielii ATCC 17100]